MSAPPDAGCWALPGPSSSSSRPEHQPLPLGLVKRPILLAQCHRLLLWALSPLATG